MANPKKSKVDKAKAPLLIPKINVFDSNVAFHVTYKRHSKETHMSYVIIKCTQLFTQTAIIYHIIYNKYTQINNRNDTKINLK